MNPTVKDAAVMGMGWGVWLGNPVGVRTQDLADALDHMQDLVERPLRLSDFEQSLVRVVPIDELEAWDDLSSWPEWLPGELAAMGKDERLDALRSFRGTQWAERAVRWSPSSMPPVVLVELADGERAVGDGRGRVSYAIGMGFAEVPVVVLRERL